MTMMVFISRPEEETTKAAKNLYTVSVKISTDAYLKQLHGSRKVTS